MSDVWIPEVDVRVSSSIFFFRQHHSLNSELTISAKLAAPPTSAGTQANKAGTFWSISFPDLSTSEELSIRYSEVQTPLLIRVKDKENHVTTLCSKRPGESVHHPITKNKGEMDMCEHYKSISITHGI